MEVDYGDEEFIANVTGEYYFDEMGSDSDGNMEKIKVSLEEVNSGDIDIDIDKFTDANNFYLDMYNIDIIKIPNQFFLFDKNIINRIKKIDLGDNKNLTQLPDNITNLKNLTYLNLEDCMLVTLPESIGNLNALTFLNLSFNGLRILPGSIGDLTALTKLNLSGNKLVKLPDTFKNLSNLLTLYLSNNLFIDIPWVISFLPNLKALILNENNHLSITNFKPDVSGLKKLLYTIRIS